MIQEWWAQMKVKFLLGYSVKIVIQCGMEEWGNWVYWGKVFPNGWVEQVFFKCGKTPPISPDPVERKPCRIQCCKEQLKSLIITQMFQRPLSNLKFMIYGTCKYFLSLMCCSPGFDLDKNFSNIFSKAMYLTCMSNDRE